MTTRTKDFGIVILLDVLGTRQRIIDYIDRFLIDWDSVLNRLEENVHRLESELSGHTYRIGIKTKDIFDNIQMHNIQFHFITPESNQVAYAMTLSLVIAKVV
ncbi:MAG: hypothetical protein ACJ71C_05220 [Nitrososphaeraceae archaeon]